MVVTEGQRTVRAVNILKEARNLTSITQQQVADAAKIHLRQYQRFESGERDLVTAFFHITMAVCETLNIAPKILSRTKGGSIPRILCAKDTWLNFCVREDFIDVHASC